MKKLTIWFLMVLVVGVFGFINYAHAFGKSGVYSGYGQCLVDADQACGSNGWNTPTGGWDAFNKCRLPGEIACAKKYGIQ